MSTKSTKGARNQRVPASTASMAAEKPKRVITRDPELDEILARLAKLTPKQVAERSNNLVGASTIRSWRAGKTKRPQLYTVRGALRAVGLEYRISKIRGWNQ